MSTLDLIAPEFRDAFLEGLNNVFEGNAELGVESPIANLTAQIQGFASGDAGAEIIAEVPAGRINCVIPAFIEAGEILADLGGTASGTISAQASFAAGLGVG